MYQPVPDDKHINDFKDSQSKLYKHLLDEKDGGQGHAWKLSLRGIKSLRIYELPTDDPYEVEAIKNIFRTVFAE